jgi:tetratricopeptide (TPR) repeat protein
VRQAALRALGKIEQPWAAGIIVNSLNDSDDAVRLEAINALETTANFSQAEQLYEVVKNTQEKPQTRLRAWEVLRNLFHDDTAGSDALFKWADRFKEEPDRQTEIWEVLRDRFTREKNERDLATVQQNIGEDKMKLAGTALASGDADTARTHAEQAEKYFDLALQYYNNHPEIPAMVTSAVLERRMDALLSSKQYAKAAQFAAESITRNASNQESMGQKLRNEIDRLRTTKQYPDAIQLIGAVHQMTPALAEPFASSINTIEADVKQKASGTQGPQSAVGSGL